MMNSPLTFVAILLTGLFVLSHAEPTIECHLNKTISITVLSSDTDYLNKTIRLIDGTCIGTAGPVSASGGTYLIPSCSGSSTITWNTEYQFLFQDVSNYWTSTDKLLTLQCVPDTANQSLNVTLGATVPTTDASVTALITPTLTATLTNSGGSSVSTAVVGTALNLTVTVDAAYASDFTVIITQVTLISGSQTLNVLDPATYCVNSDGTNLGFSNPFDSSTTKTSIDVSFSAFILTLDSAAAVSQTGNSFVFSVSVGVCYTGDSACDTKTCSDGSSTSNGRKRRDVTEVGINAIDLTKTLVVFPSKQSEEEFLASIIDQMGTSDANTDDDESQVCVDRVTSFSVIGILVGLVILSFIVVSYTVLKSRCVTTDDQDKPSHSNRSYSRY